MKQTNLLKTFLLLCALVVGSTCAWADNVEFDFQQNTDDYNWGKTPADQTDFEVGDVLTNGTLTFTYTAKGSGSTNLRWWSTGDGLRSYKGNKFKIATTSGTINSITITGTCVLKETSSTGGTISNNRNWTKPEAGGITEVEFECNQSSGNKTIKKIVVSIAAPASSDPSSAVAFSEKTPSLDLKDALSYTQVATTATGYSGTVTYTITANTAGATIDGATGKVTPTKAGSVTVEASASAVPGSWAASSDSYTLAVTDTRSYAGIYWNPNNVEIEKDATPSEYTLPTLVNPNSLTGITFEITGTDGLVSESAGVLSVNTSITGSATVKAIYAGGTHKPSQVFCTIEVYDPTEQGTIHNPYSVADIVALNPTSTSDAVKESVYVLGYIIGSCVGTGDAAGDLNETDVNTNIVLADDPTETSKANYISIQLPSGAIRTALNVVNHPYYKRCVKVLIKGDVYKYCGIPGIKSPSSFSIVGQNIKISSAGLATYCTDVNLKFDGSLEAYIAKEEDSKIKLHQVTNVPANTPILLRAPGISSETSFDVAVTEEADAVADNLFQKGTGAAVATDAGEGKTNYVLAKHGSDIGFYKANGIVVAANKAYLQTTVAAARIDVNFDETTALTLVNSEKRTVNSDIYNLAGQRVANPTKGLYIVNGRKVVVK